MHSSMPANHGEVHIPNKSQGVVVHPECLPEASAAGTVLYESAYIYMY